jgi:phospholipase A1/A2
MPLTSFMFRAFGPLALLFLTHPLFAAQPTLTLAVESTHAKAGNEASLSLIVLNTEGKETTFATPGEIAATLSIGGKSWPIRLLSRGTVSETLAPNTFAKQEYTFIVPSEAFGTAIITMQTPQPLRAVLDIGVTSQTEPPRQVAGSNETKSKRDEAVPAGLVPRAAASRIERSFRDHFAPHEPVYFIYGTKTPAAKFQLSFKYRIFGDSPGDLDTTRNSLQFGYTQRSLWDIEGSSSPFYDTSYMPEIFYEYLTPEPPEGSGKITFLGAQAGYGHESNGREGLDSRSINMLFIRPSVALGHIGGWRVILIPKLFTYISDLSDNRDIRKYRGFGEARLIFGKNEGPQFSSSLIVGSGWEHRSLQLDFSVPIHFYAGDFATYFLLQYFNGYGESLLHYHDKTSALRGGFSFVR